MALNTRKISGFQERNTINGDEYLMVAYNNRSYKIKASLFTSDIISDITQKINTGDEKDNPITITMADGRTFAFSVKNGAKGSRGETGNKGEKGDKGDTGFAIYNEDMFDYILDTVNGKSVDGQIVYTPDELASMILSARQGKIIGDKLDKLAEVYCTQEEYDILVEENKIDDNTKYFIIEEGE